MLRNILNSAKKGAVYGGATIGSAISSVWVPIAASEIYQKYYYPVGFRFRFVEDGLYPLEEAGFFIVGFTAAGALVGGIAGAGYGLIKELGGSLPFSTITSGLMGAAFTTAFAYPISGVEYLPVALPSIVIGGVTTAVLAHREKSSSVAKNPMSFYQRFTSQEKSVAIDIASTPGAYKRNG